MKYFISLLLTLSLLCPVPVEARRRFVPKIAAAVGLPQSGSIVRQIDNTGIAGADGAALTTWTAVTGNSFTGTATVKTGVNGLNSLSVAQFNGTSDIMESVPVAQRTQPVTVGLVFKYNATGNQMIFECGGINFWILSGDFTMAAGNNISIGVADTSWHKLIMVFNGASSTYSFDGAAPTTVSSTVGAGIYAATGAHEFVGAYDAPAFFVNGKLAAYYVWDVGLTSGEQSSWSTYISSKYGL